MHNVRNRMGKPFVGGKIQNINLSKINDALLYLDVAFSKLPLSTCGNIGQNYEIHIYYPLLQYS